MYRSSQTIGAVRYAALDQTKKTPTAIATADHARRKVKDCPVHQEINRASPSAPMNGSASPERNEKTPKAWKTTGVREKGAERHKARPKTIRIAAPAQTPSGPCHFRTNETSPAGVTTPHAPMKTMRTEKTTTRKAMMSPFAAEAPGATS